MSSPEVCEGNYYARTMRDNGDSWEVVIEEAVKTAMEGETAVANGMMNFVSGHMPAAKNEDDLKLWDKVINIKKGLLS